MKKYELGFTTTFHLENEKTEIEIKSIINDMMTNFFTAFCKNFHHTINTDYANEYVENDNCSHSVIYLRFSFLVKTYPSCYHVQGVMSHYCHLIQLAGLCCSFHLGSTLLLVEAPL